MVNIAYRIWPITCVLSITACQFVEGIAASTPQLKVAPTCFNKEYIIAAWWRFQQKKIDSVADQAQCRSDAKIQRRVAVRASSRSS